jgi:mRNA interferase MazF
MAFDSSDVVLVPFPFRDRTGDKARPAVVLSSSSYNANGDLVVAAITSHAARFSTDYELVNWQAAGLKLPSTVRMLLATIAEQRVLFHVGRLTPNDWREVQLRLNQVFA